MEKKWDVSALSRICGYVYTNMDGYIYLYKDCIRIMEKKWEVSALSLEQGHGS